MAMSAGLAEGGDDAPMSDINTTPLVDVMLVLLIIFLITVPVVVQTVPLKLPSVRHEPTTTKPENVSLSIKAEPDGSCGVYWGLTKVNGQELVDRAVAKLKLEIDKQGGPNAPGLELPEAHIRGDVNTPIAASAARCSTCSAPVSPASASFPSRRPVAIRGSN